MFKHSLLILLAASVISIAAFAQDAAPNNQPPAQENGGGHRGPMDPAQRTQALTQQLNLTADQQPKVQQILQSESSQMESLRSDSSLSQQDRHSKMMAIHQTADTQIRALLDSDQQKKWDAMQAKRGPWGHRRGAPNSNSNSNDQ
jgi:Spy/CpxP family protein refolding chaperone